jgi:hypothetical protein
MDRPPPTKPDETTPFERFRDLAKRVVAVDKCDVPKPRKHKRTKRRKGK